MNPSRIFILRPIATLLLMVAIFLSGLLAYRLLPQAALPQVDYPTIQVVTRYPGASPQVMATAVTAPLERQFGSMAGLTNMSSTSSSTASIITLQFGLNVGFDSAVQYVQAAINAATNFLPQDLPSPPIYNKVNPADAPVLTLAISSESMPLTELEDIVETRLSQKISQISGVGLVSIGGGQRPAVRVSLNPVALAAYGIGLDTVRTAIQAANSNQAKGNFDGPSLSIALDTNGKLQTAEEYRSQIIAVRNGAPIRLGDVADVWDGAEDNYLAAWANGEPAILLNIQRQPGANVIEVVDRIKAMLPELERALPEVVDLSITADRTLSIRSSIEDVKFELLLAVSLVVMVIFLFLRNLTATIIPSLAVPLSLVGTFSVMYLAGFSINNLTLMALTIATGFVVDDAIVMIENISRHLEKPADGKALAAYSAGGDIASVSLQAALAGSRQIAFTIISLTFSLIAVLIPLLFMGDLIGRLFREFAITLAIAILISAVVSLSLTPMLCARLLRPAAANTHGRFHQASEDFFNRVIVQYGVYLSWVLQRKRLTLLVAFMTLALTVLLAWAVPKGFFPVQDTGLIQVVSEASESISFSAMAERQQKLAAVFLEDEDVEHVTSVVGIDGINKTLNSGRMLVTLKPIGSRSGAGEVIARLEEVSADISGIRPLFQPVQDITIETRTSPTQYQFIAESLDPEILETWVPRIARAFEELPQIKEVSVSQKHDGLKAYVEVDRDNAGRLGITIAAVDEALYSAFGQRHVSTIFTQTNQYRVVLDTQPDFQQGLNALNAIYVSAADGNQIPLTTIARIVEAPDSLIIERENQFPAAAVYFNLAQGYSLGDAVTAINGAVAELDIPPELHTGFQGAASAFGAALENELFLIIAALVTMYIVLGVLYESYLHPLTILSTLPSAGVGALLALLLTGGELNVIVIIGIVLLIGIVQKNAIMMIDFALEAERIQKKSPEEAIYQACLLRFRPILMTTVAALLSAVPLVIGSGSGSELRQPLGIVMIGGLLLSQVLTLFTTPVIYLAFDRLEKMIAKWRQRPASRLIDETGAA